MNIIVLCGGLSHESEVSINSGKNVFNALNSLNHNVVLLDISYDLKQNELKNLFLGNEDNIYIENKRRKEIGNNVIEACRKADIVFLALHGGIGENGSIQALFDIYNIKYTGSSFLGSAVAMNKEISKKIMIASNIKTPKWIIINKNSNLEHFNLKFPCILKPIDSGSSIGVKILYNKKELLKTILEHNENVLIEEYIKGREFSIGILDNNTLPVIEIIPKVGFYDYENKYIKGRADEICPAVIKDKIRKKMQEIALKVHTELKLSNYSRIDFILDKKSNIYCLEANTLPGMTETSLLPKEAMAENIDFNSLCEIILSKK